MSNLLYIDRVKVNREAFAQKVIDIANRLGFNPNWLMFVIFKETAGTMSHTIQNTKYPFTGKYPGYATGLIQFTPETAIGLGTTVEKLKQMSNIQQLDFVEKFFKPFAGKIKSYVDLYFLFFFQ